MAASVRKVHFNAVGRDLYVDDVLTNMAMDYRPNGMIADMLFPIVPVNKQSGYYQEYSREDALRVPASTDRSPGTEAKKITRSVGSGTYYAKNYALKIGVTAEDKANMNPMNMQKLYDGRTQFLLGKLYLDWEVRIANQITSGTNVGSYGAVSSAWADMENSNPMSDIFQAIDIVADMSGVKPNSIVFGEKAWREFRRNDHVRGLILGRDKGGIVGKEAAKDLFEMDRILVGGAMSNAANEQQAASIARVWDEICLVYYAPMSPSIDDPSFGYSFRWEVPEVPSLAVERHAFDSKRKEEEVEAGYYQDEKVTGKSLSYLIQT